ncbi:E3 UFM1-protein ligase 1 [Strongyloides ratti]|uniref:E3 UFM1-protein ligase 1 homolog n=1 Tax=Strongyloides ratti TaxID=34506 RepID=A0A090LB35_STRRB|nr:E3 UFM1-protein ligase 1 [Strongyloides ratti]CEF65333.1 E3 UFM1-protein ligase 1 [Strongyloides ratti]
MATWADIQKLANELQIAQNIEGVKKLSDTNVIEIVSKLRNLSLIDIIFTNDGKEYVTKKHLQKEIMDECLGHKGRISMDDLVMSLNVDYEYILEAVKEISLSNNDFIAFQTELYTKSFMDKLCNQISDKLDDVGTMSILSITKLFDLPTTIINTYILNEIGNKIDGVRDGDQIYTKKYLLIQEMCIIAILGSITKITPMEDIVSTIPISENIFWNLWNKLEKDNIINGKLFGSKTLIKKCFYIPKYYIDLSLNYIKSKFDSDGIIDVGIFKKFFITNINETFDTIYGKYFSKNIIYLESIIIKKEILIEHINEMEKDTITNGYCDVLLFLRNELSFSITEEDLNMIRKKYWKLNDNLKFLEKTDTSLILYNKSLVESIRKILEPIIKDIAIKEAPNLIISMKEQQTKGKHQQNSDDEDWGTGKNSKSNKKKGGSLKKSIKKNTIETHKITLPQIDFMKYIEKENLAPTNIVKYLLKDISFDLEELFNNEILYAINNLTLTRNIDKKKNRKLLEQNGQTLYEQFCMLEQGASFFSDKTGIDLKDYLLKNTGIEFANTILSIITEKPIEEVSGIRNKIIKEMDCNDIIKKDILSLYASTISNDINSFHESVKILGNRDGCGLIFKKPNESTLPDLVSSYKNGLIEAIQESNDHAKSLLLAILILYADRYKIAISASDQISEEEISLLVSAQGAVIEIFKSKGNVDSILKEQLNEVIEKIKKIVINKN